MNYNFCAERSRRIPTVGDSLDAKYRCLFFSKIAIHISIQQRQKATYKLRLAADEIAINISIRQR